MRVKTRVLPMQHTVTDVRYVDSVVEPAIELLSSCRHTSNIAQKYFEAQVVAVEMLGGRHLQAGLTQ